jgi:antitoxin (DNA-binding transcriptional repressor) of toxin-antitoxin stability system
MSRMEYHLCMHELTVGEFKTRFSELLELVKKGERITILYGKARKPIAMLVPPEYKPRRRKLGILASQASFSFEGEGTIREDELLEVRA